MIITNAIPYDIFSIVVMNIADRKEKTYKSQGSFKFARKTMSTTGEPTYGTSKLRVSVIVPRHVRRSKTGAVDLSPSTRVTITAG